MAAEPLQRMFQGYLEAQVQYAMSADPEIDTRYENADFDEVIIWLKKAWNAFVLASHVYRQRIGGETFGKLIHTLKTLVLHRVASWETTDRRHEFRATQLMLTRVHTSMNIACEVTGKSAQRPLRFELRLEWNPSGLESSGAEASWTREHFVSDYYATMLSMLVYARCCLDLQLASVRSVIQGATSIKEALTKLGSVTEENTFARALYDDYMRVLEYLFTFALYYSNGHVVVQQKIQRKYTVRNGYTPTTIERLVQQHGTT